jgi:Putative regulator of cell autolysis
MINKVSHSVYSFLIEPRYRIGRHLLLLIVGAITTFNLMFLTYHDVEPVLGNRIYPICFYAFVIFTAAIYFNYCFLVPELLLKGRYLKYSVLLSVVIFLMLIIALVSEYWIRNLLGLPHRISSYFNPLILLDSFASLIMIIVCFLGISFLVLLRHRISRNEHVSRMEYEHLQSEINQLKGRITPGFLSKTLITASGSVKTNPSQASEMLMQLGKLLRYQLYDCNREKVLLKSEISFLEGFLRLEQLNRDRFRYEIREKGMLVNIMISPLLIITLVQYMIKDTESIQLTIGLEGETLLFQCESDNEKGVEDEEANEIKKRLNLLYPDKHTLSVAAGKVTLILIIEE